MLVILHNHEDSDAQDNDIIDAVVKLMFYK